MASRIDGTERQVQQVPDDEQRDDDTAIAHGVHCVTVGVCLLPGGVSDRPCVVSFFG
ncbi:Uncharacterised protein [Mycobacteroides abscessus subsp. massiliense]|nr:Uncharacterised protein [Mycobacteroides abscessus subsp. massiliense]